MFCNISEQAPIAYIPKPPSKKKLEAAKKSREFEKKMWNIVKEVLYYFLFLLLISFIAWGTKDDIVYKMNEHIKEVINTGALHGDEVTTLLKCVFCLVLANYIKHNAKM